MADKGKKRPEFDPALWASHLPESLRVPGGMALGALKEFWPAAPMPEEMQIPGMNMGIPQVGGMGLTTQFIKGGVPDKALRALHTQKFIDAAKGLFIDPKDTERALALAKSHPRVAAHTELGLQLPETAMVPGSIAETLLGNAARVKIPGADRRMQGKIPVNVNPMPPKTGAAAQTAGESLAHEMGHVAQGLGNKDFPELYTLAEEAGGYAAHPAEISARTIAARKTGASSKPTKTVEGMKILAGNAPRAMAKGDVGNAVARQQLGEILRAREAGVPRDYDELRTRAIDALSAMLKE